MKSFSILSNCVNRLIYHSKWNSFIVTAGKKRLDVLFQRISTVCFYRKKKCLIPSRVGTFFAHVISKELFPTLYLDLACKQWFSCQGKVKKQKHERKKIQHPWCHFEYQMTVLIFNSCLCYRYLFLAIHELIHKQTILQSSLLLSIFLLKKKATLRNKRKMANEARKARDEHLRNAQSHNMFVPGNNEE